MGDDAHQPVAFGQAGKHPDGLFQRFLIQRAEALIEEEGVQPDAACGALDFIRKAQGQCQRGLEALAAGQGLDTAAGAVVVVDDSQVKARLAALVLGTDALQLVLARRHLHQAGVGVDKDAVEVIHLNVGLQPDLLLAAQGAACRGGQCVYPLPTGIQRVPLVGKLPVIGQRPPVGQQPGVQVFLLCGKGFAPGQQLVLLCLERRDLLGLRNLLRSLPGFQCLHRSLGGGRSLLGCRHLRFQSGALLCLCFALGFQLFFVAAVCMVFGLALLQVSLCGVQNIIFLGQRSLEQAHGQGHRPLGRSEPLRQKCFGILPQLGAALLLPRQRFPRGGTGLLCGAVGQRSGLLGFVHLHFGGGGAGQVGFGRVVGAAADRAGGSLFQRLSQQARLRIQKSPFQRVTGRMGLGLSARRLPVGLLRGACGCVPVLALCQAPGQLVQRSFPLGKAGRFCLQLHPAGVGIGQSGKLCFRGRECRIQRFQRFAPGAGLGGFQLGGATGLGQLSGNLLPLALCLLCRAQRGL